MIPKTLKAKQGRIEQAAHLDLLEIEWFDPASSAAWVDKDEYETLAKCVSVGYFDGIHKCKETKEQLVSLYGDLTNDFKLIARLHSIPIKNIVNVRVVSKGVVNGNKGKEKKKVRNS